MDVIKRKVETYPIDEIYTMDETALFWKMTPAYGLASQQLPAVRKEKVRVSIVVCCNAPRDQ